MAEVITIDRTRSMVVLDRLTSVAPLGLRFHDANTGDAIGDGLNISAYPLGQPNAARSLFPNRRGVFVLHHAPGLRTVENGAGDDDYWNNLPPKKDFVIEVRDANGQSLVEMRSKSRNGKGDVGVNARRIRDFLTRVKE